MGKHRATDHDPAAGQDDEIIFQMNSTQARVYIELNASDEGESFIEYHLNDLPETHSEIDRFVRKANSLGYTADPWLEITEHEDHRRLWLVKSDKWEDYMPDLTLTGYGPLSGFMEAVR